MELSRKKQGDALGSGQYRNAVASGCTILASMILINIVGTRRTRRYRVTVPTRSKKGCAI